jgi:replicative DNA helicase
MTASFAQYGRSFQERIVQALLVDHRWAEQVGEVFNVDYLELNYLKFLADRYFAHAKKYKTYPTLQLLAVIIKDELRVGTDIALRDQIIEYLTRMRTNPDVGDLPYVKDRTLDFCRKQALKQALEAAVDQMQAEKYEQIVDGIKKAVMVGTTPSLGHDFFNDAEARFTQLIRNPIATGLTELDKKYIFNGGVAAGELAIVCAAAGAGKSHFLTMLGCNAMRNNVNVLHYTMELSETTIGTRYDSNLCDINSSDVIDSREKVLETYEKMTLGKLMIKKFSPGSATVMTLQSHLERLRTKGFEPGIIIIDYADLMRSSRQYNDMRHELRLVYQELRAFASDNCLAVWSASQSNKEGSNSEVVDLGNMSEAYSKAAESDIVVSISRRAHEKASGSGRLFIAKNRAGKDGLLYNIRIDTSRSVFEILGASDFGQAKSEDVENMKGALREKWQSLKTEQRDARPVSIVAE